MVLAVSPASGKKLFKDTLTALKWSYSLGAKFLRVAPLYTCLIVLATIVSQVALLFAFFLPLKVIILLGANAVPTYFPEFLKAIEHSTLVAALSAAAGGFYVLHMISEKLISSWTGSGASKLVASTRKVALFDNQQEVAGRGYQRYTRFLASLIFIFASLFVLSLIFPKMLVVILLYFAAAAVLVSTLSYCSVSLSRALSEDAAAVLTPLAAAGFLVSFGYIVFEFMFGNGVALFYAVVALLLSRQIYNRGSTLIIDLSSLYGQRLKLNALFFQNHVFIRGEAENDHSFWGIQGPDSRDRWLDDIIKHMQDVDHRELRFSWFQTGVVDVVGYVISARISEGFEERYFIKIFNRNRESMAIHEATLLTEIAADQIHALPLVGVGQVEGFHYHLFSCSGLSTIPSRELRSKSWEFLADLARVVPPAELVARFSRSKPLLWQRLSSQMIDRLLLLYSESDVVELINNFGSRLEFIKQELAALPVVIVNPDINADTAITTQDKFAVIHWGGWALEPLGAGWPTHEKSFGSLFSMFQSRGADTAYQATYHQIKLASLMSVYERHFLKQRYQAVVDMIPSILECIDIDMHQRTSP